MRKLSLIEAACLVAGAGIGGGVMAVPYLVTRTGLWPAILIMLAAYAVTLTLHVMIAELSIRTDYASELLTVFSKHLFHGRQAFRNIFYALMAVTLICNLAAYITGSGEILADLFNIPQTAAMALFFAFAAFVVLLGLKQVAINETAVLTVMLALVLILAVFSFRLPEYRPLPPDRWAVSPMLAVYGMVMFSFSSLFAVPQAASGLGGGKRLLMLAVGLGLFINLIVTIVITLCTLLSSDTVTEVAIVGWAEALGGKTRVFGAIFIVLAMLTTFWSISLQLSDMSKEYFHTGRFPAWLIAVAPSFLLALSPLSGFLGFMQIAGGATALAIAFIAVPAYRNATRHGEDLLLGSFGKSRILCGTIVIMYILMAAGSFL